MSIRSPGIALTTDHHTFHLLCFQQRKTDRIFSDELIVSDQYQIRLTRLPYPESDSRWQRMNYLVTQILQWIESHTTTAPHCFIENYSFGADSSSVTRLAELGGILRVELYRRGWEWTDVAPSSSKKRFSGSGRSDKAQMYTAYQRHGFPSMLEALRCQSHQSPVNDLVDALALLWT